MSYKLLYLRSFKNKTMRKKLLALTLIVSVFALNACDADATMDDTQDTEAVQNEDPDDDPVDDPDDPTDPPPTGD